MTRRTVAWIAGVVVLGVLCVLPRYHTPLPPPSPYLAAPVFDNREYYAIRDSTRALVRRLYRGDTTTARAQAYFRLMDSAYAPTYLPPALGH